MLQRLDIKREWMLKGFEQMHHDSNRRLERIDKRFEQVDKQLEKQSQAIMNIHQEIKLQMRWSFGAKISAGGLVVGILKLMGRRDYLKTAKGNGTSFRNVDVFCG